MEVADPGLPCPSATHLLLTAAGIASLRQPSVQDKAIWLVAAAGVAVLLIALLWQWARQPQARPDTIGGMDPGRNAPGPVDQVRVAPSPAAVRVEILNGCGAANAAARLTRRARSLGLDVIDEGNAESFGFLESMVIDRRGRTERAQHVAQALGIPVCIQQITRDPSVLAEVTVIIGRDHPVLGLLEP